MTDATDATPEKDWQRRFLEAFAETGMVSQACRIAGINRSTAYRARQRNESFALAWADVEERTTEELEQVARQRAVDGSDTLMIFLLKARRPETYRENVKIEHSGQIRNDLSSLSTEELRERARALLAKQ